MNGRELLEGMGYIDERFVDEAETATLSGQKRISHWRHLAAVAACACVAVGCLWIGMSRSEVASDGAAVQEADSEIGETGPMEKADEGSMKDIANSMAEDEAYGGVIWIQGGSDIRGDMEACIPEDAVQVSYENHQAFELLGGVFLPEQLLETLVLETTEQLIWEEPNGVPVEHLLNVRFRYGDALTVTACPTELTDLPEDVSSLLIEGCIVYPVDRESISSVNGSKVLFFEIPETGGQAERTAKLVVSVPGGEKHVLLSLHSDTLSREEMEQAVAEILEFGG